MRLSILACYWYNVKVKSKVCRFTCDSFVPQQLKQMQIAPRCSRGDQEVATKPSYSHKTGCGFMLKKWQGKVSKKYNQVATKVL